MAQNISLLGADYSAVPSVLLPKTGGGTASFTDVTDTTAAAADVAAGKYFYTASGVRTLGTGSGGGGGGSLTQDENGYLVVPTTGGGGSTGLEYETGTWTPTEDVSLYYATFSNPHTTAPMFYAVADMTTGNVNTYSNFAVVYANFESAFGGGGSVSTTQTMYGLVGYRYNTSSTTSSSGVVNLISVSLAQSDGNTSAHPTFWATNQRITFNTTSNGRYFYTGHTYKWIAVWAPTT